jgi:hypothetical protein
MVIAAVVARLIMTAIRIAIHILRR